MTANAASSSPASLSATEGLHVLTLTPFYPVEGDDGQGCFIAEPLPLLEREQVTNTVFAVQPFYRSKNRASRSAPPASWQRFPAVPGNLGLASAGAFLYAKVLHHARRLHHLHPIHVIHAQGALPCGHAAALLSRELGIPFVVTVHGLDAFSTQQIKGFPGRWAERVSQWVYRSACSVICISEKVQEQVVGGSAGRVNTTVIYNGVDPDIFSPSDASAEMLIVSVGNLIPIKGHDTLLRALAEVQNRFPGLRGRIIGDGPERDRLKRLAADLGIGDRVEWCGRQSRASVAEAMRSCTIFALPSRFEGLGCVYLEAMSSEKPVIACHGQGIDEVIRSGINGWLVEPENPKALAEALTVLLGDEAMRRQIGRAARHTILHGFTYRDQAAQLGQVYRECRA